MGIAKFNKTTEKIWNYLMEKLENPYGAAALMGAMFAESAMIPNLVNSFGKEKFERPDIYTSSVRNEIRSMEDFVYDGYAYGICQWSWWVSKQGLFNMARKAKKSIGSLPLQLDFLWDELHMNENKARLKKLTTVQDLDICVSEAYKYVTSHIKKNTLCKCAVSKYAGQYYDYYFMHNTLDIIETKYEAEKKEKAKEEKKNKHVVAWANNVSVRIADDCHSKQVGTLRTDASYEYIMSNKKKTWHCIMFDGKLRWVSGKNTQVINA